MARSVLLPLRMKSPNGRRGQRGMDPQSSRGFREQRTADALEYMKESSGSPFVSI